MITKRLNLMALSLCLILIVYSVVIYLREKNVDDNVNYQLRTILDSVPSAAHARLGFLKKIPSKNEGKLPLFSFNMHYELNNKGFEKYPVPVGLPLSVFNDMIPVVLDNVCIFIEKSNSTNPETVLRMSTYHINSFIACPVGHRNNVLGIIILSWDQDRPVPRDENIALDTAILLLQANKIYQILRPE